MPASVYENLEAARAQDDVASRAFSEASGKRQTGSSGRILGCACLLATLRDRLTGQEGGEKVVQRVLRYLAYRHKRLCAVQHA